MIFNTYIFIFAFLPICFAGYYFMNHCKQYELANIFLIIMSSIFFWYSNVFSLIAIWISILGNYMISMKMKSRKHRKVWLTAGIVLNCAPLLYTKYLNFFVENWNMVLGIDSNLKEIIVPLGISYFTFQQVAYLVDCYRGEVPEYSFTEYCIFIIFFPKAMSGPIMLHSDFLTQIHDKKRRNINYDNISRGIYAFSVGMAKKVLLADTFGKFVDAYYANIASMNKTVAILAILGYTFQLYFDFSGYCDMATGICLLFNIEIPVNFNSPYKAASIGEFWDRWHITLTRFFTKYIYIPLGGNRKGKMRTYVNTLIVFLISGLWHGAEWSFIFWGLVHGVLTVLNKVVNVKVTKRNKIICTAITFVLVNVAWIYFRASDMTTANQVIKQVVFDKFGEISASMANLFVFPEFTFVFNVLQLEASSINILTYIIMCSFYIVAFVIVFKCKNVNEQIRDFKPTTTKAVCSAIAFGWSVISFSGVGTFLYSGF